MVESEILQNRICANIRKSAFESPMGDSELESMMYVERNIKEVDDILLYPERNRAYVIIGEMQTGKTMLVKKLLSGKKGVVYFRGRDQKEFATELCKSLGAPKEEKPGLLSINSYFQIQLKHCVHLDQLVNKLLKKKGTSLSKNVSFQQL